MGKQMTAPSVRLVFGSDHAGRTLRHALADWARAHNHEVVELGPRDATPADYPDCAAEACAQLTGERGSLAVLVCGTGIGMSLAANACTGVRASVCTNEYMARMSRAHNDVNALCLGERVVGVDLAVAILGAFLATPFAGGRHGQRLDKLERLRKAP